MERELHEKEELLTGLCPECGGRMISSHGVIVYCEEAYHNPYSDCQNIIASG